MNNVVRYMDTSAAAYRLVSAACNLPFLHGKWQAARHYLNPGFAFKVKLAPGVWKLLLSCEV